VFLKELSRGLNPHPLPLSLSFLVPPPSPLYPSGKPLTIILEPSNPQQTPHFARPVGTELVCKKHPLAPASSNWNYITDRFITYLATHAPLDRSGNVPRQRRIGSVGRARKLLRLVMGEFPEIGRYYVSPFLISACQLVEASRVAEVVGKGSRLETSRG